MVKYVNYILVVSDTDNSVSLREKLRSLLSVTLSKTACYDNFLECTVLLKLSKLKDSFNSLFLCRLNETAGIYNGNIRKSRLGNEFIAFFLSL